MSTGPTTIPITPRVLGRRPARHDLRTLQFSSYAKDLAPPPDRVAWSSHTAAWPMMMNDRIGDCTLAAAGHLIQCWTAFAAGPPGVIVPDAAILQGYQDVGGYDPKYPTTDQGCVELDVLKYWMNTGIAGHKIGGFTAVDPQNVVQVKQATHLFGGLYLGLALPNAAQDQIDSGKPWDVTGPLQGGWRPGSWGGHAVPIVAYDPNWITVITWSKLQGMSWRFFLAYCEEAWAVLGGTDWIGGNTPTSPSGFDLATLEANLDAISTSQAIHPVPTPVPTPTPTPVPTPTPTPTPHGPTITGSLTLVVDGIAYDYRLEPQ